MRAPADADRTDPPPPGRQGRKPEALETLGDIVRGSIKAALPTLVEMLKDKNADTRFQAVYAFNRVEPANMKPVFPILVEALKGSLQDPQANNRSQIVALLLRTGSRGALSTMRRRSAVLTVPYFHRPLSFVLGS